MQIQLVPADRELTALCEPLSCERSVDQCPVGPAPLSEVRNDILQAALATVRPGQETLLVHENAWISPESARRLLTAPGSDIALVDSAARVLAWKGPGGEHHLPQKGRQHDLQADAESLLVCYPWDLLRVNELFVAGSLKDQRRGEILAGAYVDGVLDLGEGSRLLPGTVIEGTVCIGRDCRIGPNCYLRGKTVIGDRCHIGQAVEVKNSVIMADSSIAHLSYCGDSLVGTHVNFGAGTIVANLRHDNREHRSVVGGNLVSTGRRKFGTVVGDRVHTGIHTSIYPGRKLWPGQCTRPHAVVVHDLR